MTSTLYNKRMKLFFDARFVRTDFPDSMSRCSVELGTALAAITKVTFIIHDRSQLGALPAGAAHVIIHPPTSWLEPFTSLILNRYKPDVVFSPMQTLGTMGRSFKVILTLHDLIYYHYRTPPAQFNPVIRFVWRLYHASYIPQRLTLNSADMIATVSETSKKEIVAVNLTKRPIVVIPNAPRDLAAYLASPVRVQKSPKNLVYMGTFMGYKNVETLIAGMAFLPGRILHILSPITAQRRSELEAIIPKGSAVIFHGGVSDEVYANLLADNAVLVTATRDEGFCLPVAEALALGVPAVISDLPVLHEVAGQGALYFNPSDPREFAQQVMKLDDAKTITDIARSGKKHIAKYDWSNSAKVLLQAATDLHTAK
jgi:glycosyltransferase involved in cell wall biosynthesis